MPKQAKDPSIDNLNSPESCEALLARIRETFAKSAELSERIQELQAGHAELLRIQKELNEGTRQMRAESRRHSRPLHPRLKRNRE